MAKNMFFNKYDIFISYPYEIQSRILELYEIFTTSYGLNVWCDVNMTKPIIISPAVATAVGLTSPELTSTTKIILPSVKMCENINNSKFFLLAVHACNVNYEQCERELYYAIQQKKRILCMMFANKPLHEYHRFGMLIQNLPKIEFYKDSEILKAWTGPLFDKFIDLIELMMNKKINRSQSISITGLSISTMSVSNSFKSSTRQLASKGGGGASPISRYNQIKSSKPLNLPAKRLSRMCYLQGKRRIVLCDSDANLILLTDSYGKLVSKQSLEQLKKPCSVCCSRKGEIFIGDATHERIFVFDSGLKFKRSFDYLTLSKQFDMALNSDDTLLYVIVHDRGELLVVNSITGELEFTKAGIQKPTYVKVKDDKIYVISNQERIVVLRSDTYDILKEIHLENWCYLKALYIDNKMNIITTAYEKNFPIAFLYVVDLNGNIVGKIYIHMKEIEDMMVLEDKKFFFNSETSSLCVLEFE